MTSLGELEKLFSVKLWKPLFWV